MIKNWPARMFMLVAIVYLLPGSETVQAEETTEPQRLRVMSYNIHHGAGGDGEINLERIAEVIRSADIDIVALQEVDVKTRRSHGVDQLAELARLTKMEGRFGKAMNYHGGEYGQAVLSRYPIKSVDVHLLPDSSDGEQRIALVAHITGIEAIPDLMFVGVHLDHRGNAERLDQARRVLEILENQTTAILVGDFNAVPGSEVMDLVLNEWVDTASHETPTAPADNPTKKIDWVLLPAGNRWRVESSTVINEPLASDHRPVVVDLRWTGK